MKTIASASLEWKDDDRLDHSKFLSSDVCCNDRMRALYHSFSATLKASRLRPGGTRIKRTGIGA